MSCLKLVLAVLALFHHVIAQTGSCDVLSDPENGEVTFSSTVYLSRAVYSCNDGYELSQTGSVVRICRTNGQWSSFAPQCNPVDCGVLLSPNNGAVSLTGTTFMNTATYSCNIGHTLINGDQVRECQSDRTWSGIQPTCQDVDECNLELDGCHGNATCQNTNGSFECLCDDGYEGDGFFCTDIDECLEGIHTCGSSAVCTNINGGFECACLLGYEGDGFTCENIDECLIGTHKCHEDAECTDTEGSYSCDCNLGFSGDGLSCERQCSTVFQLFLNGVNNCQRWALESTEEKLRAIQWSVFQEILRTCPSCKISRIVNDEFSCPIGPDSDDVLYRARLYGTQPDNCLELITAVTNWVQSPRASLQVQNSRLQITGNCVVEIDSLQSDLDCPLPTTEAEGVKPGASAGSGTVIGAAAGVVGTILLLTIIVVIIAVAIIFKKNHKSLPSYTMNVDKNGHSCTKTTRKSSRSNMPNVRTERTSSASSYSKL